MRAWWSSSAGAAAGAGSAGWALPPVRRSASPVRARDLLAAWTRPDAELRDARAELEAETAAAFGTRHAVLVPRGRDGLGAILRAVATPARREVVLPAWADASLPEAVRGAGLEPVACDVRPGDGTLDAALLAAALSPRTCAVVALHVFGHRCDLAAIAAACAAWGAAIVEDAAHAPFRPAGEPAPRGLAAFTSFAPFKLVDCGGGGAVATDDGPLAAAVRAATAAAPRAPAVTVAARLAAGAALAVGTAPPVYGTVGHAAFARLASAGDPLAVYKRRVRPYLKRGADDALAPWPAAPWLRSGARQLRDLASRVARRRELAARLRARLPAGALLGSDRPDTSAEYEQIWLGGAAAGATRALAGLGVGALPAPMVAWPDDGVPCPVARSLAARAVQLPFWDGMRDEELARLGDALARLVQA